MNDWKGSPLETMPEEATLPLWRRTQLKLDRLETLYELLRHTDDGSTTLTQLRDETSRYAQRKLVLLLKEWEERKTGPVP